MRRLTSRQRTATIVLAAIAVCFVTLDLGGGGLRSAHSGVRGALGSLYRGTDALLGPVRRFVQGVPSAAGNQARIDALEHDNATLRGQLAAAQADKATQAHLAALQLSAQTGGYRLVPARVLALGPGEGFDWTVTLDVGAGSGVKVGQTVTDGAGLVGRVLHADSASCVVLLAADPGSGVGARDLRTGELGIATGDGVDGFSFVTLSAKSTVRVGDAIATGPAGVSSYVAGIAIGTVRSVRNSADGTSRASIRPATSPTALDLVGVIVSAAQPVADRAPLDPGATGAGP